MSETINQHAAGDPANPIQDQSHIKPEPDPAKTPIIRELREPVMQLFSTLLIDEEKIHERSTPIHVDEIASKVAKVYELIRKVIDWKEDNQLRRSATERILKRVLFPKLSGLPALTSEQIAETVTIELIRGGHLPNDTIPKERILIVQRAVEKYLYLLEHGNLSSLDPLLLKKKINFVTFLIEIASCEIEEILTNPVRENGIIRAMTELLDERIDIVPESGLTIENRKTQLFIAVCRALFNLDDSFISFQLLKFGHKNWVHPNEEFLKELTSSIQEVWMNLERQLSDPVGKKFFEIADRVDTIFLLFHDYITSSKDKKITELKNELSNETKCISIFKELYAKRYKTLKQRLFRLGVFSTLSVFLSNFATFYIIEVPLAHLFYEGFNLMAAIVDFTVPTLAMFLLVSIIKPPGSTNEANVIRVLKQFLYEGEQVSRFEILLVEKHRPIFRSIVLTIYTFLTIGFFSSVAWIFYIGNLPITSVIFDTATIAMNIFAAVIIRNRSKELTVNERVSMREFLLDMISVPVAKIGGILSSKWKEYNIVAILFTFFIETPFSIILSFIEEWSKYLKERKAEIH